MTYPNMGIEDPTLSKKTAKDDQLKEWQKNWKIQSRIFLETLKNVNNYYKKKHRSLNENKVLINNTAILLRSASTTSSGRLAKFNPSAGNIVSSSTALLTLRLY